jgi:hypothetical protein
MKLWRQYMEEEYPQVPAALVTMKIPPFFRVVPINEKIETKSQVLAYEDAARIVENASVIAVTNCPCRMIMRKCDKPIDVCLQINKGAQYALKRGTGRRIDAEEAKTILRRAEASRSGPSHGKQSRYRDGHLQLLQLLLHRPALCKKRRHQRPARSQPLPGGC